MGYMDVGGLTRSDSLLLWSLSRRSYCDELVNLEITWRIVSLDLVATGAPLCVRNSRLSGFDCFTVRPIFHGTREPTVKALQRGGVRT